MSYTAIQKTKEIASFLRNLFNAELHGTDIVELPNWSVDLLEDCRYAVKIIVKAIKNRSKSADQIELIY